MGRCQAAPGPPHRSAPPSTSPPAPTSGSQAALLPSSLAGELGNGSHSPATSMRETLLPSSAAAAAAAAAARTCRSGGRPSSCSSRLATPTARHGWRQKESAALQGLGRPVMAAARWRPASGGGPRHLWAGRSERPGARRCRSGVGAAAQSRPPAGAVRQKGWPGGWFFAGVERGRRSRRAFAATATCLRVHAAGGRVLQQLQERGHLPAAPASQAGGRQRRWRCLAGQQAPSHRAQGPQTRTHAAWGAPEAQVSGGVGGQGRLPRQVQQLQVAQAQGRPAEHRQRRHRRHGG